MSVGIFKNGKYNKVAGNAKDSTAANTTYNNGTSGLQANNVQSAIDELNSNLIKCKMIESTTNPGGGIHIQNQLGVSPNKVIAITLVGGNLEIYPIILDNGYVVIKKNSGENYINSEVTLNVWYIN